MIITEVVSKSNVSKYWRCQIQTSLTDKMINIYLQ